VKSSTQNGNNQNSNKQSIGGAGVSLSDIDFQYPEELVATERVPHSRVMWVASRPDAEPERSVSPAGPIELSGGVDELLARIKSGDGLVVNDTRVLRRRVFTESGLEILFLNPISHSESVGRVTDGEGAREWRVLCPATRWKPSVKQVLPGGIALELVERGKPQTVRASQALTDDYFERSGELPLPPYIQKARGERHQSAQDSRQYQTAWAARAGSLAAPTASLHFTNEQLDKLRARGVVVFKITLHVGIGTFLPVTVERLADHVMHAEYAEISADVWRNITSVRERGGQIWAMGTTVVRTLESVPAGLLQPDSQGGYFGETALFITPGFEFRVVDVLLTNFHQPRSTLIALVAAFAGLDRVKQAYAWAIERKFRLFSYGDLTAWQK
jgi:S-adenosylmethionine:tRNA ribosyltransferase-isomerase